MMEKIKKFFSWPIRWFIGQQEQEQAIVDVANALTKACAAMKSLNLRLEKVEKKKPRKTGNSFKQKAKDKAVKKAKKVKRRRATGRRVV